MTLGDQITVGHAITRDLAAEPHKQAMGHIMATLQWLADNEPLFRALAQEKHIIAAHPGVQAVLDAWPGAQITAIRDHAA